MGGGEKEEPEPEPRETPTIVHGEKVAATQAEASSGTSGFGQGQHQKWGNAAETSAVLHGEKVAAAGRKADRPPGASGLGPGERRREGPPRSPPRRTARAATAEEGPEQHPLVPERARGRRCRRARGQAQRFCAAIKEPPVAIKNGRDVVK